MFLNFARWEQYYDKATKKHIDEMMAHLAGKICLVNCRSSIMIMRMMTIVIVKMMRAISFNKEGLKESFYHQNITNYGEKQKMALYRLKRMRCRPD